MALKDGRLVARDTPERFMQEARLREIYGIDMAVLRHPASGACIAVPN